MIKLKLADVECFERDVKLRLPFRFGVITVTQATQAVIRATIELEGGRRSVGVAAESLAAKWFDKNPAFSDAQNLEQLRQSLALAIAAYRAKGWSTPFAFIAGAMARRSRRGAELGLVPLVASYGPALLDRAILDAVGRELGLSFAAMIARNVPGIAAHGPDARSRRLRSCRLSRRSPARTRHCRAPYGGPGRSDRRRATRRRANASTTACRRPWRRSSRYYRGRYYKLKVAGDVAADLERLTRIARVLDRETGDYRATLDGNEQYDGRRRAWPSSGSACARPHRSRAWWQRPVHRAADQACSGAGATRATSWHA